MFAGAHYVQRVPIRFRTHGHGLDTHPVKRPNDPARDSPAVSDQNLGKQLFSLEGFSLR
jgi:hypothetical protein